MNILFVPSKTPNGLEDIVYSGLNKINSVKLHEYRLKPSYHPDLVPEEELRQHIPNSSPAWLMQPPNGNHIYLDIGDINLGDFDYIIFGRTETETLPLLSESIKKVPQKTVFLDGEDDPLVRFIFKDIKAYFKREKFAKPHLIFRGLNRNNTEHAFDLFRRSYRTLPSLFPVPQLSCARKRIHSLNLTVIEHKYIEHHDLDIDVSLVAKVTNKMRLVYSNALRNIAKRNRLNIYINTTGLNFADYLNVILRSKLVISIPGAGYDCFRYWEVPYYERCLLSYRLPIVIENNFVDYESALFFSSLKELEEKILWGLKSDSYENLRGSSKTLFNKYHTDRERASRLLKEIT